LADPRRLAALGLAGAALLAGCAGGPGGGARPGRDGPEANPPANLAQVPDAEPRIEAIRGGGANKPYTVLGRSYTPLDADAGYRESGLASWYGRRFHGASTSNGERYDMYAMTAAHPTLPIPSYAWVRNPANGREVVVRINDRGPFHDGRIIDLSYTAAYRLDLLRGVAPVEVERITPVQIATGSWRRGAAAATVTAGMETGAGAVVAMAATPVPTAGAAPVLVPAGMVAPAVYTPAPGAEPPAADLPSAVVARDAGQDPPVSAPAREILATPLPALPPAVPSVPVPASSANGGRFWVQLGAFSRPEGARAVARRAGDAAAGIGVTLLQDGALQRVQAGPFASREAARDAASRLGEALQLAPVVVERP